MTNAQDINKRARKVEILCRNKGIEKDEWVRKLDLHLSAVRVGGVVGHWNKERAEYFLCLLEKEVGVKVPERRKVVSTGKTERAKAKSSFVPAHIKKAQKSEADRELRRKMSGGGGKK